MRSMISSNHLRSFVAGFAGIGLQMLSYRIMNFVVGDSNFVFALVLGVFVFSIALGGLLSQWIQSETQITYVLSAAFLNIVTIIALTPQLPEMAASFLRPILNLPNGAVLFHILLAMITFLVVCVAAVGLAATTPFLSRQQTTSLDSVGRSIGQIWAANSLGCLFGTAFFGVFFFWVFGLKWTLIILALGIYGLTVSFNWKFCILLVTLFWIPFFPWSLESLIHSEIQSGRVGWPQSGYSVIDYQDTPLGSFAVAAFQRDGQAAHRIVANGRFDASSIGRHEYASRMVVTLPLLFSPAKQMTSAMIGLGGGRSLDTMARSPQISHIDLFEIAPVMISFQKHFFPDADNPLYNQKVSLHIKDAYVAFDQSHEQYDLISSEPSQLWASGVAPLYSFQFNQKVRSALKENGIYAQWIPTYALSQEI